MAEATMNAPPGDKKVGKGGDPLPKGKKGGTWEKYKWYIVGGLGLVAVLVFYFVQRSNSQSAAAGGLTASGTPATGLDPSTEAALQAALASQAGSGFGQAVGPQGPAGPAGPPGKRGPRGPKGGGGHKRPKPKPHPPPKRHVPTPRGKVRDVMGDHYAVRPGDTLQSIASQLNYPGGAGNLYNLNRHVIGGGGIVHPGMRLTV